METAARRTDLPKPDVRVDYAGPGGACEGIRRLGHEVVGYELDDAACVTRIAAGHRTVQVDLGEPLGPEHSGPFTGYWASPPCQSFSIAGGREGHRSLRRIVESIERTDWGITNHLDDRTRHVVDAARTALDLNPGWIVFEQVRPVLPIWESVAEVLEAHGYSAWVGAINAADHGLPQTRIRAFLIASRTGEAGPPPQTHAKEPTRGLAPWVSVVEALGWSPRATIAHHRGSGMAKRHGERKPRPATLPAPTITGGAQRRLIVDRTGQGDPGPGAPGRRLDITEALVLQGFPADYPLWGNKTEQFLQVGNAVPPPLAEAIVATLAGERAEQRAA